MPSWARSAAVGALVGSIVVAAAGCRGREAAEADARSRPPADVLPASSAPFSLAAGTPAGGLEQWTSDVGRGLSGLPALAARDAAAAQKAALDLYLTRQEYIEMYWGSTGKLTRGATLGPAVAEAERRFHEILSQLQPGKPPDTVALRAGLAALESQYAKVRAAAAAAGVATDPHAVAEGGVRGPAGGNAPPTGGAR